jgi:hypothetical protein
LLNDVFKVDYISTDDTQPTSSDLDCIGSLNWPKVKKKTTLEENFLIKNIGKSSSNLNWKIKSYPDWGIWEFSPESGKNLTPEDGEINVYVSVNVPDEENTEFEGYITIENQDDPNDFDVIPIYLKTPRKRSYSTIFLDFIKNHPNIFPFIQFILKRIV